MKNSFDSPVVFHECGGAGAACITESGTLYTIGDIYLQQSTQFEKLALPYNQKAKHVSIGYSFIVVTTSNYFIQNVNKIATGKVYAGMQGSNKQFCEIKLAYIRHVEVGYSTARILTDNEFYALNDWSEESLVKSDFEDSRSIKLICGHLALDIYVVLDDNTLYRFHDKTFVKEETPPLAYGETIVTIRTGYNYKVVVRVIFVILIIIGYWYTEKEKIGFTYTVEIPRCRFHIKTLYHAYCTMFRFGWNVQHV
jgi:hypothetical protein